MDVPRVEGFGPEVEAAIAERDVSSAPFTDLLGIVFDLFSPDRVEAHLPVTEQLTQPYGIVHGGVHASLVETLGSVAGALRVLADGDGVVGVHNSTDFLRPVREGTIHAVCTPVHVGRSQHLWLTECRDDDDRLLARGQLRVQVVGADRVS